MTTPYNISHGKRQCYTIMNQSIQSVPIPSWATAGHLLVFSVPGVGHFAILLWYGGCALAYPGAIPGHLTCVFERWMSLSGRTRPLSKTGLAVRD